MEAGAKSSQSILRLAFRELRKHERSGVTLVVLKTLILYAATALLGLYVVHRRVRVLSGWTALFLAGAPMLLCGGALSTGGVMAPLAIPYDVPPLSAYREAAGIGAPQSPILNDVVASYIPWRKAVRDAVFDGRLPLWNPYCLAGEPLLAAYEPAVFHPATWIGFLLPLPQSWTLDMALRIFLALLCAHVFLREIGCGEIASWLGASGWAFSDFLVFYLGFPLSPTAAVFPLLLVGLRRLARDSGPPGFAVTVASLLLIATGGHPETLFHCVAAGGLYFLFQLRSPASLHPGRAVGRAFLAGVLALGLLAVVLLPFAEILTHTKEHALRGDWYATIRKSLPLWQGLRLSVKNLMPYAFGISGKGALVPGFEEPAAYGGALLLPFAVVGALSKRRERWPLLCLGLLGLCLWARLPIITDAVSALPLFNVALNQRLAFIAVFALAALAGLGAERIARGEGFKAFLATACGSLLVLGLLSLRYRTKTLELGMPGDLFRDRFLFQVVPLGLAGVLLLVAKRKAWSRHAVLLGALGLFLIERRLEAGGRNPTRPSEAFYPPLSFLDRRPPAPGRFASLDYTFPPNAPTLYGLEDIRGYTSIKLASLAQTLPLWSEAEPVWWNRVTDPTHPFLAFLNVTSFLARPGYVPPAEWRILAEGPWGVLFENPGALPRAFVPSKVFFEPRPWEHLEMVKQNRDFKTYGVFNPQRAGTASSFSENSSATARITSYHPDRLDLAIDAERPVVVGTSIPRWPGWKLTINGRHAPLGQYNWAFLGFEVPAGKQQAILRYLPDGFVYGAVISISSALLGLLAVFLKDRRQNTTNQDISYLRHWL